MTTTFLAKNVLTENYDTNLFDWIKYRVDTSINTDGPVMIKKIVNGIVVEVEPIRMSLPSHKKAALTLSSFGDWGETKIVDHPIYGQYYVMPNKSVYGVVDGRLEYVSDREIPGGTVIKTVPTAELTTPHTLDEMWIPSVSCGYCRMYDISVVNGEIVVGDWIKYNDDDGKNYRFVDKVYPHKNAEEWYDKLEYALEDVKKKLQEYGDGEYKVLIQYCHFSCGWNAGSHFSGFCIAKSC